MRRFFRTPKGLLTLVFAALLAMAAPVEGLGLVAPGLAIGVAVAAVLDLVILRLREGAWAFPSGAVLTGLIVVMVLSPYERWYVIAVTSALAIASKYLVRTKSANVFNPAALAIVATFYVFETGQSWWGALPDLHAAALVVLLGTGIFIADRVNKLPLVIAFLGTYYLPVHHCGVRRRAPPRRRDLPRPRSACRPLLRVLHPHGSADVPGEVPRPDRLRRARRGGELCRVRVDRRGVLPARRGAGGQPLGGAAAHPGALAASYGTPTRARSGVLIVYGLTRRQGERGVDRYTPRRGGGKAVSHPRPRRTPA